MNQVVVLGNTATMNASVTGALPLTYTWYFSNDQTHTRTETLNSTHWSLTITNVTPTQAGLLNLQVSNSYGITPVEQICLAVISPTVQSNCFVLTAVGPTNYIWQLDGATDLGSTDWVGLTNFSMAADTGSFCYVDPAGANVEKFYRMVCAGIASGLPGIAGYYVDSINGNDTNSGLSPATPFKTIAALGNADFFRHTNLWNFAAGSHWREQLDVRSNNMTLRSYGSGSPPLFDASDVIPPGAWTKVQGLTNTYVATVATSNVLAAAQGVNVFENGVYMFRATGLTNCDLTPMSYWITNDNSYPNETVTIWINPTNSTNPETDTNLYEFTSRQCGVFSYASNCVYDGLWTRRNLLNDGSFKVGYSNVLANCMASDGGKHNLAFAENCILTNVVCSNAYYTYTGQGLTMFICTVATGSGGTVAMTSCSAFLPAYLANYQTVGFYGHSSAPPQIGSITYNGCTSIGCAGSFDGLADLLIVSNCVADGSLPGNSTNITIVNSTICTTNSRGFNDNNTLMLTISNSTLQTTAKYGIVIYLSEAVNVTLTNCVLSATNSGWAIYQNGAGLANFASVGNSMDGTFNWYRFQNVPNSFYSDYNSFGPSGSTANMFIGGTNYSTFASYVSALGSDVHSTHP
jgi:hypothetical protein